MLAIVLLPIIVIAAWYLGYKCRGNRSSNKQSNFLHRDYFIGLQYLIDEQPDKAVDVFVKLLEVNSDTVETHLALGGLFRKRGEVNRAIRIHQNIIARPHLDNNQRLQALFELAQDYLHAGVLDRAEKLFLELIKSGKKTLTGCKSLLSIYEQQKEWQQAIDIARKMEQTHHFRMRSTIAHYYCELGNYKKALLVDKKCVRASLLQGEQFSAQGDFKAAIRSYNSVREQDQGYISEIIEPLAYCYENLREEQKFINHLESCLKEQPRISIILALAGYLRKYRGDFAAIEFITDKMRSYPSLRGLSCLTELYINNSSNEAKNKFVLLQDIMDKLLQEKPIYRCSECGFAGKSLFWQCPACKRWGSVKPIHGLEGD